MWHDFEMSAEGCGSDHTLNEGASAYRLGASFLASAGQGGCHVVCEAGATSSCSDVAPVRWHFEYDSLPPVIQEIDCPDSYV